MEYWNECISEAFEEAGITTTQEQIDIVAGWAESGHDHYGMAHGYEHIPDPQLLENEKLRKELEKERTKVTCDDCGGKGRIITNGPYRASDSECSKCRGEGRYNY